MDGKETKLDRFAHYQAMRVKSAGKTLPTPIVKDEKTGELHLRK